MRKALAVIYCPRCGTKHEVGMEIKTSDNGTKHFYEDNNTCGNCKARFSVYASEAADFLSVTSMDFGDKPYEFIKEDLK